MKKFLLPFALAFVTNYCISQSVGIGTNSPNSKAILDLSSTTKGLLIPTMTTAQMYAISTPPNGLLVFNSTYGQLYQYYDGWKGVLNSDYWIRPIASRSRIGNTSDSVGIGTISPTEWLDVDGNIKSRTNIRAENAISAGGTISGGSMVSLGNAVIVGTTVMNDNLNANADININNTTATLQLKSSSVNKGFFQLSGDNVRLGTNSGNSAGDLIFRLDGTDRIFINNSGNMGLGSSSPGGRLHVAGRSYMNNGSGEALAIDGTNPFVQFYQAGTARSFLQQNGSTLKVGVNNGKLQLDATQIAIGTVLSTADAYRLSVTGKIICEELKVKLSGSWPDYVFADGYQLPSLKDLQSFINTNKHLPNIPAAAEIQSHGMEVGDMQRKMMEKIEELTLYIIDLQNQVDELKKK